jgi:hypothetical protein
MQPVSIRYAIRKDPSVTVESLRIELPVGAVSRYKVRVKRDGYVFSDQNSPRLTGAQRGERNAGA